MFNAEDADAENRELSELSEDADAPGRIGLVGSWDEAEVVVLVDDEALGADADDVSGTSRCNPCSSS